MNDYAKRLDFFYFLLSGVFGFASIVAFVYEDVTLLGRAGGATFSGKQAFMAGAACLFVSAYWMQQVSFIDRSGLLVRTSPYLLAAIVSAVFFVINSVHIS